MSLESGPLPAEVVTHLRASKAGEVEGSNFEAKIHDLKLERPKSPG